MFDIFKSKNKKTYMRDYDLEQDWLRGLNDAIVDANLDIKDFRNLIYYLQKTFSKGRSPLKVANGWVLYKVHGDYAVRGCATSIEKLALVQQRIKELSSSYNLVGVCSSDIAIERISVVFNINDIAERSAKELRRCVTQAAVEVFDMKPRDIDIKLVSKSLI